MIRKPPSLFVDRRWLHAKFLLQESRHLAWLCMSPYRFLAEEDGVIGQHLEASSAGRNQFQGADRWGEEFEQFARQTEGARGVVSHHAVFDAEIELFHDTSFLLNDVACLAGEHVVAPER